VTSYLAIAGILSWVLRASHSSSLEGEIGLFFRSAGLIALLGTIFWTLYVAVEPYVRRLWPDALLGWSRLLAGHIRDPRVGRDLLIGMVFGVALILVDVGKAIIIPALGYSAPYARYGFGEEMYGDGAAAFWAVLIVSVNAIDGALFVAFGIVIARLVLRIRWLAIVVTMLFLSLTAVYDMSAMPYSVVFPPRKRRTADMAGHAIRSAVARRRVVHVEAARRGSDDGGVLALAGDGLQLDARDARQPRALRLLRLARGAAAVRVDPR
jgi:hypothetical protein